MTDRAHLAFALALHRVAAPDLSRNACWSPYSVASALGLAAEAARGETRQELITLLGEHNTEVLQKAASPKELAVANTLWASDQLPLNQAFSLADQVRHAPFVEDPEAVRKLINEDVSDTTRGLIPELLPPGAVSSDAMATIVNALYLRTAWLNDFPEWGTQLRPFHAPSGKIDAQTMRHTAKFRYAARDGWQTVVLPAEGGVEAVVLLPDNDLAVAEAELDAERFTALLDVPQFSRVDLSLPKLDVTMKASLKDSLVQLGVWSLFSPGADFSGLSPDPRLFVDDVLHEAVLRIDEEGLEGAAATSVMFRMVSLEIETDPVVVEVDRPYLLLVRHAETGAIYFFTRVTQPG